jgi:hypothetical protein
MRDMVWRVGLTLSALTLLSVLGPGMSCSLGSRLIERATGQTPQAQIADYLAAIAGGNPQNGLALWSLQGSSSTELEARREAVTTALLAIGPSLEHQMLDVTWWRTCCEPAVIDDPDKAGGARVRVAIGSKSQPDAVYLFDLLVPGGYRGEGEGYPVRDWVIVDVYPEGEAPLAWTVR